MSVDEYLREIIDTAPKLSSTDADQLAFTFFESKFSFFNHLNPDLRRIKPLGLVSLHENEENSRTSLLSERIDDYLRDDILRHTGLSIEKFFALPREITHMLHTKVQRKNSSEQANMSDLEKALADKKGK